MKIQSINSTPFLVKAITNCFRSFRSFRHLLLFQYCNKTGVKEGELTTKTKMKKTKKKTDTRTDTCTKATMKNGYLYTYNSSSSTSFKINICKRLIFPFSLSFSFSCLFFISNNCRSRYCCLCRFDYHSCFIPI